MKPFVRVSGRAAVLDRVDVDTDQIVPKQFLKSIERTGFGKALFFDWMQDPDFELRRPEAQGARILIAGANFGCGSSREHAAWALLDHGFEVVIAPSFGDIFWTNATKIGLLPVTLPSEQVRALMERAGEGEELTVDLEARTAGGFAFEIDESTRQRLLHGIDDVDMTLRLEGEIAAYEAAHPAPISTLDLRR